MKEEIFETEKAFEDALIEELTHLDNQWEQDVLEYKTEKELIDNWKHILEKNNQQIDRLNGYPITDSEMKQILDDISSLKTPLKINNFINGKTTSIIRDNKDDKEHFGKRITLKIYDRQEIATGKSRYQIARQPLFNGRDDMLPDRRGDLMLLINGMPVIHIELKKNGVPLSKAYNQIEKYSHEKIFTGLFSLIQIFVAMTPSETVYFANPGEDNFFNEKYYFHWADFRNEQINYWRDVSNKLLSIPMAHELIGFYTVPDDMDNVLKVLRSYQYYAINEIHNVVNKCRWDGTSEKGGYIWHTTGSGKTMTSFKTAELIANSKSADKVIFMIDRIELGNQSLLDYRGYALDSEYVQDTANTDKLVEKLKSDDDKDTLIVTSIQKMSNIDGDNPLYRLKQSDLDKILNKRIVFIVDECHRDTFGTMMAIIKNTFKKALFFGFTGTPIQEENEIKGNTTKDVFGNELHRYSIADGIRDKNVLGFDSDRAVLTFKEKDEREAIALAKAKAKDVQEALSDSKKSKVFYHYMNEVPMAGRLLQDGTYEMGIEDCLKEAGQYRTEVHQKEVVQDIKDNFQIYSHNYKFHAIFATSSIEEAIIYYNLLKKEMPEINIPALFDPSLDNNGESTIKKEDALVDIISDYNNKYFSGNNVFNIANWSKMKKDIQLRLAHKKPYERIENEKERQINLLIVVDQMLTGYDSKWVNALYLDKVLKYQDVVQAYSRTNRLNGENKTHGIIRYYRMPYTMKRNEEQAFKIYSDERPFGIFVSKLDKNIDNINAKYSEIKTLFEGEGIINFEVLPKEVALVKKFVQLFNELNRFIESARVQGFKWKIQNYYINNGNEKLEKEVLITDEIYNVLLERYKEVERGSVNGQGNDIPYDLKGYIMNLNTDAINQEYMENRFKKYIKELDEGDKEKIKKARDELLHSFASLSQIEQKYAKIFLHDLEAGELTLDNAKSINIYISEYINKEKNDKVRKVADTFGIDEEKLRKILNLNVNITNFNDYGRFDDLCSTVDIDMAVNFFESISGKKYTKKEAKQKFDSLMKDYILSNGLNFLISFDNEDNKENVIIDLSNVVKMRINGMDL